MYSKVIQDGYASDLERTISADLKEIIRAQIIHQEKKEKAFLSTITSEVKKDLYTKLFKFIDQRNPDRRHIRSLLLEWYAEGLAKIFPAALSACFIPNDNRVALYGEFWENQPDSRCPAPVVKNAHELEKVLFSNSSFDILKFGRANLNALPNVDSRDLEKKVEQMILKENGQTILVIPVGQAEHDLLGALYVEFSFPLSEEELEVLTDSVYLAREENQLLSAAIGYRSYPALYRLPWPGSKK
jgi:hypothetical protein